MDKRGLVLENEKGEDEGERDADRVPGRWHCELGDCCTRRCPVKEPDTDGRTNAAVMLWGYQGRKQSGNSRRLASSVGRESLEKN